MGEGIRELWRPARDARAFWGSRPKLPEIFVMPTAIPETQSPWRILGDVKRGEKKRIDLVTLTVYSFVNAILKNRVSAT